MIPIVSASSEHASLLTGIMKKWDLQAYVHAQCAHTRNTGTSLYGWQRIWKKNQLFCFFCQTRILTWFMPAKKFKMKTFTC